MPFDFKNRDRIKNLLQEMKEYRYKGLTDITEFLWWEDDGSVGNRIPKGEGTPISLGFQWKGWDRYNWITTSVELPQELIGHEVIGLFDFGARRRTGNNGDFESLLYLNETPYQAVDGNHTEVFLEPKVNGRKLDLKFRIWSGLSEGGIPKEKNMELIRAQYGVLHHPTDDLYYLTEAALDAYDELDANNEHKEWILNQLVKAYQLIDFTDPRSEVFYQSTEKAYAYLAEKMDGSKKPGIQVSMLGHTHIDVAWLWRLRHTREKAARSFSTVNRLMEKYDHYLFLQSQPQLYEYIKEDYPDIYEHIKKRVKEGRWEPSGAMWVECDCNLVSGESIIRQILVGKNFFRHEFDYESEFLWLPDVFGYSWALPQILKKSGIDTFMTTKISWNDTNRLPYDTFLWRGMDGTEVTAHFITTSDDGEDYYTYNGESNVSAIKSVWDNYKNKDINKDLLISYGYGDGGGGPSRDMIKQVEAAEKIPGIPHVIEESATQYFRRLNKTIHENKMDGFLPVWDGELYLEFHRGTYTSQAYSKNMNRRMEYGLRELEIQSIFAGQLYPIPYRYEELLSAWKIVLCHQFHDILPGSSIREVYEDSHVEYGKAQEILNNIKEEIHSSLYMKEDDCFTVFNNSNWVRDSIIKIPVHKESEKYRNMQAETEKGELLSTLWEEDGAKILVKDMKPLAFQNIYFKKPQTAGKSMVKGNQIETPYYKITWEENGSLSRIYDKEADRELLPTGKCGNVLQVFEDKPRSYDAWELEPTIDLKREIIENCISIKAEKNELGFEVTFEWKYHNSTISQRMCLYDEKKRIDFKTQVDWKEHQKLMKVAFPVDIRATDARFDIQNGNIRRPITRNTSWEAAKFEVVAHKWADLWETGYGLALLNDCKYGYDIKDDTIRLTLLKSAIHPDFCADNEIHTFTYSILPHHKEWYQAAIEQEAFDLNNVLTAFVGRTGLEGKSLFSFDRSNLVVDAVKREENGENIILRFHEFWGERGNVRISSCFPIKEWCLCDLMEEPEEELKTGEVNVFLKPYEIITLMIRL